jgi:hypothetical protein
VRKWLLKGESWTSDFFILGRNLKKINVGESEEMDELRPAAQPIPLTTQQRPHQRPQYG